MVEGKGEIIWDLPNFRQEDARNLVETATLAGAVIVSGQLVDQESRSEETYQIEKKRAADRFRKEAVSSNQDIQLALSLPEVLALAQDGLMKLALAAFTKLAEEMMRWEVGSLVGPRNKADAARQ